MVEHKVFSETIEAIQVALATEATGAQWPRFRWTGWPQIRPPRSSEAKNYKHRDFTKLEGCSLLHTSRPPLEAIRGRVLNLISEAVRGHNLKIEKGRFSLF